MQGCYYGAVAAVVDEDISLREVRIRQGNPKRVGDAKNLPTVTAARMAQTL
jgi:hypothetical protein